MQVQSVEELAAPLESAPFYEAYEIEGCREFYRYESWTAVEGPVPAIVPESAFKPVKGKLEGPAWWRATFTTTGKATPLMLDLAGLTKGQVYLNGKHLGRYFIATAEGKKVAPQDSMWLPDPWLREPGAVNELTVFDEHGHSPARCRLHFEAASVPVRAHLPAAAPV